MKYAVIGAGGTGGIIGSKLSGASKDVTLIARGRHLEAIQKNGLKVHHLWDESSDTIPVKACTMEEYAEKPDVIIVCVKGYSTDSVYPFIRRVSKPSTIVIPVLNIFGTGAVMQENLPGLLVTDGCIYVSSAIENPGVLLQHGKICRIIFGVRKQDDYCPELDLIARDFSDCGIDCVLSDNIQRDALTKFSYVSPIGAAGLYYGCTAGDFQREGRERELFISMIREIESIGHAMGIEFKEDLTARNLDILSTLTPDATTSMQRDVMAGKPSEIDGLVFQVVRMGHKYNVPVPCYEMVSEKLKK